MQKSLLTIVLLILVLSINVISANSVDVNELEKLLKKDVIGTENEEQKFKEIQIYINKTKKKSGIKTTEKSTGSKKGVRKDKKSKFPMPGTVSLAEALNVRKAPWGKIIGLLKKNDKITITGEKDEWFKINYKGSSGFIHSSYVKTKNSKAVAFMGYTNGTARIFSGPDGKVVGKYPVNTKINEILKKKGEYHEIKYNGKRAYIKSAKISKTLTKKKDKKENKNKEEKKPPKKEDKKKDNPVKKAKPPVSKKTDRRAKNSVAWAKRQLGRRDYKGWCQKFVHDAYRASSPRYASAKQCWLSIGKKCKPGNVKNLPVGAILFFDGHPKYGHVGIHIGGGKFIHGVETVRIDNVMKSYHKTTFLGWGMPPKNWPGR